ncbi:MAG: hypothetical protein PQJ58_14060, partial [Spirochaetales bacterium]|nr:hypothetical protein [Spirochaetales bacterium]
MPYREYRDKNFVPLCVDTISHARNPEFRTCEVLRRIDNLMKGDEPRILEHREKIKMLKSLKKGLEAKMGNNYRINRTQHNVPDSIHVLIDRKIEEYTRLKDAQV